MKATAYVRVKTHTADLLPALEMLRQTLQPHAEISSATEIILFIYHTQDAAVARALAQQFPNLNGTFMGGKKKHFQTAGDFLKFGKDWLKAGFIGTFPAPLGILPALDHLEQLLSIADIRARIEISPVRWHGDMEGWTGSLNLRGSAKSGTHYDVELTSTHEAISSKDEAHEVWKRMRSATGLPFGRREVHFFDPTLKDRCNPDTERQISACFYNAVLDTTEELMRTGAQWQNIARVESSNSSINTRLFNSMAAWGTGRKPIPFESRVKAHLKKELPDLQYCRPDSPIQHSTFRRILTPATNLLYHVKKAGGGLGKAFELDFGVEFPNADYPYKSQPTNIFQLYRRLGSPPLWVYDTEADLEEALGGLVQVIRETGPILERNLTKWLPDLPTSAPEYDEIQTNLSAKDAVGLAEPIARNWKADAYLCDVSGNWADRFGRNGQWRIEFADPADPTTLCRLEVAGVARIPWGFVDHLHQPLLAAALVNWVDSPEAWAAAQKIGESRIGPGEIVEGRIESRPASSEKVVDLEWLLLYRRPGAAYDSVIRLRADDLSLIEINIHT